MKVSSILKVTMLSAACCLATPAFATWDSGSNEPSECDGLYDGHPNANKLENICRKYCDSLDCPNLTACPIPEQAGELNAHSSDSDSDSSDSDSGDSDSVDFYSKTKQCKKLLRKFDRKAGDEDVSLPCIDDAKIEFTKVLAGQGCDLEVEPVSCELGSDVTFTYTILNAGSLPLNSITLVDTATLDGDAGSVDQPVIDSCAIDGGAPFDPTGALAFIQLEPGSSIVCTSNAQAVEGEYENTATVTAIGPDDEQLSAQETAGYLAESPPAPECICADHWMQNGIEDNVAGANFPSDFVANATTGDCVDKRRGGLKFFYQSSNGDIVYDLTLQEFDNVLSCYAWDVENPFTEDYELGTSYDLDTETAKCAEYINFYVEQGCQ